MWSYLFVVGAWLTITPPPEYVSDTTSVFMVGFSRVMELSTILNINNYSIKSDDGKSLKIYEAYLVTELDSEIVLPDTSLVALITDKLEYRKFYTTTVSNVRDKTGNVIDAVDNHNKGWYFYNGYLPNIYSSPSVDLGH